MNSTRTSPRHPAKVGDTVIISHGRCCGRTAKVTLANAHMFKAECPCGGRLYCPQSGGYLIRDRVEGVY